jgi:two-component system, cell cycle sensor histidine kinase and response regulator CckA
LSFWETRSRAEQVYLLCRINYLRAFAYLNRSVPVYADAVDEFRLETTRFETIGSAAAGIAHDINNQLTLIVNHLSFADVQAAQAAVDRCSALTASLLSYCKGEAVEIAPLDPVEFLRQFTSQLCLPNAIEVTLNTPSSLPAIMANPLALTRVLTNLISNACAAMNDRGRLRIAAALGVIEVSDSGPGISAESRAKIFEPFFSTKGGAGTGLGLLIVRELMRQQGGTATLRSEAHEGARFTLHFRRAPARARESTMESLASTHRPAESRQQPGSDESHR